jgi:dTDP-4-amino-4,6-dideoxygalactose transaminase
VPLFDLSHQHLALQPQLLSAIACVLESGQFILGPECQQLESEFAQLCRTRMAIACASGSDALLLALSAIELQPGDEVIVPSFTFFATASAVWRLGARPVFVDIDPATFNLDPGCVANAISPRTKAIIAVHLFGQCAGMEEINRLSRVHGLVVIEDCAQAIAAMYQGRPAGSLGDIGCFSLYPTKNLGGLGDAGMLTTSNAQLAERLRLFRNHGMQPRYYHRVVGVNSRLDTIQAAVLLVKLPFLSRWTEQRTQNARRYDQLLADAHLDALVVRPQVAPRCGHVWNQYTIRIPNGHRDALRDHLSRAGIGSEIYYPVPLHLQDCFASLGYQPGSLPQTERAAGEVLSLPIFPGLTQSDQERVVRCIAEFFQ